MAIKWQSFCWTHRAHSTVKVLYAIVRRYLHSAPWFHQCNATIYFIIFKRMICNIWICSRNMAVWRSRIVEIHHSNVCNSSCEIGVSHMKPNMGRMVVNVYWRDVSKYHQNKRPNCKHCENKSNPVFPILHAIWCHIRVLSLPVIPRLTADCVISHPNSSLVSNHLFQCCLHPKI